jgi:hypothetical protein
MLLKRFALGVAALLMAHGASAQLAPGQFYGAGSLGLADWTGGDADDICDANRECDQQDTGFKLLGGYRLAARSFPNLAVEAGYWNFGSLVARNGVLTTTTEAYAVGGGVAYHMQFAPKWQGLGRLGLVSMRAKIFNNFGGQADETSLQFYGGLSLGYAVAPNILLEGSWDISQATIDDLSFELNAVSLGVRLAF